MTWTDAFPVETAPGSETRGDYWITTDAEGTAIEGAQDADYVTVRPRYINTLEETRACAILLAICVLNPRHPRRTEALQRARELGLID